MARLLARCPPEPALRLSRLWAVRSGERAPLQSQQITDGSLREVAARQTAVERCPVWLPRRQSARRSVVRSARQCAPGPEMPGRGTLNIAEHGPATPNPGGRDNYP